MNGPYLMKRLAVMCITTLVLSGNVVAGSIYKCIDAAGNVSFTQKPCPRKSSGGGIGYSERSQWRDSSPSAREQLNQIQRGHSESYRRDTSNDYDPSSHRQYREMKSENIRSRNKYNRARKTQRIRNDRYDADD